MRWFPCPARFRAVVAIAIALLLATPTIARAQDASPPPGTPAPEAAPSPSPSPAPTPTPAPPEEDNKHLQAEIDALKSVLDGKLPEGFRLAKLADADLRDEEAVAARVEALEKAETPAEDASAHDKLAAERDQLRLAFLKWPAKKRLTLLDEEEAARRALFEKQKETLEREIAALRDVADGRVPENFAVAKLFEVNLRDEEAIAARVTLLKTRIEQQTAELSRTAPPEGEPVPMDFGRELSRRLLERDALRLRFLGLDAPARTAVLDADEKKRRLAEEKAAAEKARAEAEEAERTAEEARLAALEEARLAATAAEKAMADERARLEQARATMAGLKKQIAEERQALNDELARVAETEASFRDRAAAPDASAPRIDTLFGEVVALLTQQRKRLEGALASLDSPSRVPEYEPQIDLADARFADATEEIAAIRAGDAEIADEGNALRRDERDARWAYAQELAMDVKNLNAFRLQLIPHLTPAKRNAILGLTREGFAAGRARDRADASDGRVLSPRTAGAARGSVRARRRRGGVLAHDDRRPATDPRPVCLFVPAPSRRGDHRVDAIRRFPPGRGRPCAFDARPRGHVDARFVGRTRCVWLFFTRSSPCRPPKRSRSSPSSAPCCSPTVGTACPSRRCTTSSRAPRSCGTCGSPPKRAIRCCVPCA
ncbi:MAG: hypothetical protein M5R36_16765 [Deltaproteobacteria bacterium]|nr:hypothetical protein [Deltaproteobacteria bacterium]